jgi:hypothetical protein
MAQGRADVHAVVLCAVLLNILVSGGDFDRIRLHEFPAASHYARLETGHAAPHRVGITHRGVRQVWSIFIG